MSPTTALVSFAAELVTMLVAASGLVLVTRSSEMADRSRVARGLLAGGFVVLGVGAFLHGSLIIGGDPGIGLAASRLVAVAAVLAGALRWPLRRILRCLLVAGLVLIAAASVAEIFAASVVASDVVLAVGALAIGTPLAVAGRRSIATRVAVASAGTLLLVLVILSVAMSQVISSSITDQSLKRLAQQARSEGSQAASVAVLRLFDARSVAVDLSGYFKALPSDPLVTLSTPGRERDATAQGAVQTRLDTLSSKVNPTAGLAYVSGVLGLYSVNVPPSFQVVAATSVLQATSCPASDESGERILVSRGNAWAVGTSPECGGTGGTQVLGTVVTVTALDGDYLARRLQANQLGSAANDQTDRGTSLAFVTGGRVLARVGTEPPARVLTGVGSQAIATRTSKTVTVGDRFLSAQPIDTGAGSAGALSVVVSSPTTSVVATRERLFRTLFLVALGSTLAALVLAVLVGERITRGVRRLTEVATGIQAGRPSERAGVLGTDEVGVLGAAFDSMIDSVEEHAAALQAAADDETRLRNRLEAVVAGIGDSLVAIDVDGKIIELNAAAEVLFGLEAGTARGRPVTDVIVGESEDGTTLDGLIGRPRVAGWGSLATVAAAGGTRVPVAISAGAVRGPAGELIGAVLVLRDLRGEQELERMKTEFLSRVGHELRSPLTGIMGYADILLRREVEPDRARGWHEEILSGAKRLLRIVEMLEFFASAGAGQARLRPEPLDVRSLVSGVAARWSARLGDDHPVVRRVNSDTPPIFADRRWLVLAIDELVDNAAKFSPSGGRIAIWAAPAGGALDGVLDDLGDPDPNAVGPRGNGSGRDGIGGPPLVEIAVIDRGEGMTPEQRAVAFGDFVQVDTSDTRRFGGLGLGLALVKRVVEGHGGQVTCRSEPGRGSVFTVCLPAGSPSDQT